MSQNRSSAFMAQRVEPHDSLDFFPTPPWAGRALIEHVLIGNGWSRDQLRAQRAWEPACGTGDLAWALAETFRAVSASDVHDYSMHPGRLPRAPRTVAQQGIAGGQDSVKDFLIPRGWSPSTIAHPHDWVITNPPFNLASEFALTALGHARAGVALLVRTAFVESIDRYKALFSGVWTRPAMVAVFVERVPMFKGRLDAKGSSATSYCWIVWRSDGKRARGAGGRVGVAAAARAPKTELVWIPPCRKDLTRPGDYPSDFAAAEGPARAGALL